MPWQETSPQQERRCFIEHWSQQEWSMTQLCKDFGIALKTGYKWLRRYQEGGWPALADRSRAPHAPVRKIWLPLMVQVYHLQKVHPDAGAFRIWSLLARAQTSPSFPGSSSLLVI